VIAAGAPAPVGPEQELAYAFFDGMGPDLASFADTYRKFMADDVLWETVGLPARKGLDEAVAYLGDLNARTGMTYCRIELLAMASAGPLVLTERNDIMLRSDHSEIIRFRIAGALEIVDGRIRRYTDYCDLSPLRG
jgi:limonene-1,2-epoxide hydrolase